MNRDLDRVHLRQLDCDFDELTGRAAPPDRLDEILRRAADPRQTATAPVAPRTARLGAAALVLLGATATLGVLLSDRAPHDDAVAAQQPAAGAVAQEPQPAKPPAPAPQEPQPAPPAGGQEPAPVPTTTAPGEPASPNAESPTAAARVQLEYLRALQLNALTTARPIFTANVQVPALNQQLTTAIGQFQIANVQRANVVQGLLNLGANQAPNPLRTGDYGKALDGLAAKLQDLQQASKVEDARRILDELALSIDAAKLALWKRQHETPKEQAPAGGAESIGGGAKDAPDQGNTNGAQRQDRSLAPGR